MKTKLKICIGVTLSIGLILFVLGLVLGFAVFPSEVDKEIKRSVELETGTDQWDRFVKLPLPLDFKAHIFVIDNKEEFLAGDKALLKEVGPYVYKEDHEKQNLEYENDKEFVSYNEFQHFTFDKELSNGEEDDPITVLNLPYIATLSISEGLAGSLPFDFEIEILPDMFHNINKVFIDTTIKELLFDGIKFCEKDKLKLGAKLYCMVVTILNLKNIREENHAKLFSYLDFKKDKDTGRWKVNSGINEEEKLGEIKEWNQNEYTEFWKGAKSECDKIQGRDSTIYPPFIEKEDTFQIYSLDICRSVGMRYDQEITFRDIDGYRFTAGEDMFTVDKPEESCYCVQKTKNTDGKLECYLDGVIDLYNCYGAPLLASYPHFLFANPRYSQMVDGLRGDIEKHTSYADIEPNTGTPLRGVKRVQLNVVVRKIIIDGKPIETIKNVKGAVIPVIWIEEGTELNDELIDTLNSLYFDMLVILEIVKWTLTAVGLVIAIATIGFAIWKRRSN